MSAISISVAPDLSAAGVAVSLGIVTARVSVAPGDAALVEALAAVASSRVDGPDAIAPADVPEIAATRRAYKALGKDPSRYRPSVEALLRRLRQGKGLFHVNNVVDVNNLISLKSGFCVGTYDTACLRPPLTLRSGAEGETYDGIGRGSLNIAGLPLLVDEMGPFGSPTSDSERTMIRPETESILMVLYDFEAAGDLDGALDFAAASLETHCQARDVACHIMPAHQA